MMSEKAHTEIVAAAIERLNEHYVFPEVAAKVERSLREKLASSAYKSLTDPVAFAKKLTEDLQAVTNDKHLRVRYSATPIAERGDARQPSAEEIAAMKLNAERTNFGVERVERLPHNIGYVDLRGFGYILVAGETISAAMSLIAHTDALIVDLRKNGGGDPSTVAWMLSYLVDERTHLVTFFERTQTEGAQSWTSPYVPGKVFGGKKPIYVLTSKRTFSGAEEFSYNVKALKRGTIVGETTGGGAHPGGELRLSPHFMMFVPSGRPVSAITKTNWEGVGVEPDVKVLADDALRTAQILALKKLLESEKDARRIDGIKSRIAELEREARM
ncbi:MAG: S41 family peptidase [Casimicrobium sp.]